jgi:hypothetical protein
MQANMDNSVGQVREKDVKNDSPTYEMTKMKDVGLTAGQNSESVTMQLSNDGSERQSASENQ